MEFRDYYATLGVKKDASHKAIRSAFRKLAREHHPDVNPENKEAEARFKEINEAHDVLSDPEKRKLYDQLGARWREYEQYRAGGGTATPAEFARATSGAASGAGSRTSSGYRTASEDDLRDMFGQESPYSDFFGDLFGSAGGSRGRSGPSKGSDVEAEVTVSLADAFNGTTVTFTLTGPSGVARTIEAAIPRGVRDGSRVRLAGQGNPGRNGGPAGDLYLVVAVTPHERFRREGDNLRVEAPVNLTTCMLGGEVHVRTLRGSRLAVRVPPETQNGTTIRLRGQGMPRLKNPATAGDLFVEVHAVLPTRLTSDERELFVRLAELRGEPLAAGGAA
jgi:curved DNA-binding protein